MMKPAEGSTVRLVYKVIDEDGRILDQALSDAPLEARLGTGALLPEIEARVAEMSPGERTHLRLERRSGSEQADRKGLLEVPRALLPDGLTPRVGMALMADGEDGRFATWIREVRDDVVVLDTRHPLAGLSFDVELELIEVLEDVGENAF